MRPAQRKRDRRPCPQCYGLGVAAYGSRNRRTVTVVSARASRRKFDDCRSDKVFEKIALAVTALTRQKLSPEIRVKDSMFVQKLFRNRRFLQLRARVCLAMLGVFPREESVLGRETRRHRDALEDGRRARCEVGRVCAAPAAAGLRRCIRARLHARAAANGGRQPPVISCYDFSKALVFLEIPGINRRDFFRAFAAPGLKRTEIRRAKKPCSERSSG